MDLHGEGPGVVMASAGCGACWGWCLLGWRLPGADNPSVTINSVGWVATMILAARSCAGDAAFPASVCAASSGSLSLTRSAMFEAISRSGTL